MLARLNCPVPVFSTFWSRCCYRCLKTTGAPFSMGIVAFNIMAGPAPLALQITVGKASNCCILLLPKQKHYCPGKLVALNPSFTTSQDGTDQGCCT